MCVRPKKHDSHVIRFKMEGSECVCVCVGVCVYDEGNREKQNVVSYTRFCLK